MRQKKHKEKWSIGDQKCRKKRPFMRHMVAHLRIIHYGLVQTERLTIRYKNIYPQNKIINCYNFLCEVKALTNISNSGLRGFISSRFRNSYIITIYHPSNSISSPYLRKDNYICLGSFHVLGVCLNFDSSQSLFYGFL